MISLYKKYDQFPVAVDCIIFGFDGTRLKALLIHRSLEPQVGKWSLMGGFVNANESVDNAAKRILFQLTGLEQIYMEQLYCFGDTERDKGGRVISIAYFALIRADDYDGVLMSKYHAKWFGLDAVPKLIFDHEAMLEMAKGKLQQKVARHPIGFSLLPDQFTLPQLQALYEAIYEMPIDKRNFAKKILSLGILKKLDKKEKTTSRKGAFYYVFDKKKYAELEREGMKFM
jgi:8-oxo-dGTP diphosphatase